MPDNPSAPGTIIRTVRDRSHPYVLISRAIFEDERLGWETRGLLGYLLSKPDGWQVRFTDLLRRGNAGRERLRRMLHELQTAGYLQRQRSQDANGFFVWVYLVYESPPRLPPWAENPPMESENPQPWVAQPPVVEPPTGQPPVANPPIYKGRNGVNTDSVNKERERAGAPPPTPSPSALEFTLDDAATTWWRERCAASGPGAATLSLEQETASWRDEIAAGRRPVPVDPAADWRQWMRRAISWAHAHPPKEGVGSHGSPERPAGPGARPPGQPDPERGISDEQYRDQLATTLRGILVPPPA